MRLAPGSAELVERSDVGSGYLGAFGWEATASDTSYVRIIEPENTYIFIERPTKRESKLFSAICHMATRNFSPLDGDRAFFGSLKNPDIGFGWGDQFLPRFTIDRPAEGYRKRLRRVGAFTYIDVAVYRDDAQVSDSKESE